MNRSLLLIVLAGCGDAGTVVVQIEAVSGERIKLEKFLYADGTREVDASGFFDTRLHTRCTARTWADGIVRCVPVAGDAIFTDATCTTAVGVAAHLSGGPANPVDANWVTHFIGYDVVDGITLPARLYSAGAQTDPVAQYFARQDGMCVGPLSAPVDTTFYSLANEIDPTAMPVFEQTELGTGRLALRMLGTIDGMRVPFELYDRELDMPCTPMLRTDGVRCEPYDAFEPTWFLDSLCSTPVVVVEADEPLPPLTRFADNIGCASYAPTAAEVTAPLYRRFGSACIRTSTSGGQRAFTLGDPVVLPALAHTIEDDHDRRLAHVTLQDGEDRELRFPGTRLYDRAIRGECRREVTGDSARCIPAVTRFATTAYRGNCSVPVQVVELPARTCVPIEFATTIVDGSTPTLHAIGNRVDELLSWPSEEGCVPFAPTHGHVAHYVGPALPPETFMSALRYGER